MAPLGPNATTIEKEHIGAEKPTGTRARKQHLALETEQRIQFGYVPAIFLLLLAIASISPASASSILDYSEKVLRPFFSVPPVKDHTDWDAIRKKGDPLAATTALFNRLREARISDVAKSDAAVGLDMFINHWPNTTREGETFRWNYNEPYNAIPPGWWSGMDGFLAPVVLVAASEIYKRPRFRNLAHRALNSALRSPLEGGSLWRDGESCWISEYSWKGMSNADEYHVLNGHLFGLQALKMVADALNDKEAHRAFECATHGTTAMAKGFHKPGWSLYMLNKPTIDPAHYLVFELSQFDALSELSKAPVFASEAARRREIFARQYPIYLDRTGDLVFSRFGAPHPYNIDIYRTRISCDLADGTTWIIKERVSDSGNQIDRGIIRRKPPATPLRCTPISMMGGHHPVSLYTAAPRTTDEKAATAAILPSTVESVYDAELAGDREITVKPGTVSSAGPNHYSSVQARITFSGKFDLPDDGLFGIEITMPRASFLSVTLTDTAGHTASRYYQPLSVGKQIILLSKVGFNGYETLGNIISISISLPSDEKNMPNQSEFRIEVGDVVEFRSAIALEHYLRATDRTFPEAR